MLGSAMDVPVLGIQGTRSKNGRDKGENEPVHSRTIWPIPFDTDDIESLLLNEEFGNFSPLCIELLSTMRSISDQDNLSVSNGLKEGLILNTGVFKSQLNPGGFKEFNIRVHNQQSEFCVLLKAEKLN
jgi:hypothetical protein